MFILLITIISTLLLLRTILIVTGLLKEPILRRFEKYGDDENLYYALPDLLLWSGTMAVTGALWLATYSGASMVIVLPGVVLLGASVLAAKYKDYAYQHAEIFLTYPHWLYDLVGRTSRSERRRIAYMWLYLPLRTRVVYNSSDAAFLQWADFVIMATML